MDCTRHPNRGSSGGDRVSHDPIESAARLIASPKKMRIGCGEEFRTSGRANCNDWRATRRLRRAEPHLVSAESETKTDCRRVRFGRVLPETVSWPRAPTEFGLRQPNSGLRRRPRQPRNGDSGHALDHPGRATSGRTPGARERDVSPTRLRNSSCAHWSGTQPPFIGSTPRRESRQRIGSLVAMASLPRWPGVHPATRTCGAGVLGAYQVLVSPPTGQEAAPLPRLYAPRWEASNRLRSRMWLREELWRSRRFRLGNVVRPWRGAGRANGWAARW